MRLRQYEEPTSVTEVLKLSVSYRINLFLTFFFAVSCFVWGQTPQTTGVITTYAGSGIGQSCNRGGCTSIGGSGFSGDGGAAVSATLYAPEGVAADASGNVYVADSLSATTSSLPQRHPRLTQSRRSELSSTSRTSSIPAGTQPSSSCSVERASPQTAQLNCFQRTAIPST